MRPLRSGVEAGLAARSGMGATFLGKPGRVSYRHLPWRLGPGLSFTYFGKCRTNGLTSRLHLLEYLAAPSSGGLLWLWFRSGCQLNLSIRSLIAGVKFDGPFAF